MGFIGSYLNNKVFEKKLILDLELKIMENILKRCRLIENS